jgi:NADPH-dependent 2,4-dienoyl-CoA reductase/sulfur reductase-like enzyme
LSGRLSLSVTLMRGASSNIRRALCVPRRKQGSTQVLLRYFSDSKTNTAVHADRDVVVVGGGPAGLALASALGA